MGSGNQKIGAGRPSDGPGSVAFQAGVLAGAGILSRVIGLLYRSPLYRILGDEGNGYYGSAYAIYAMIIMITTYSIPTAVSRLVAGRIAVGEYRNARRIYYCSFVYVVIAGAVGGFATYACAGWLVGDQPDAAPGLRVLSGAIFLSGFLAIFRGYLQAYNTMVPTSVSQIVEQLANAAVSIMAAYLMAKPYAVGTTGHARYGAAGSAMGTVAGMLCGLIYILSAYAGRRRDILRSVELDATGRTETYGALVRLITATVTPVVLAAAVCNVLAPADMKLFFAVMGQKGGSGLELVKRYGIYSQQYTVLTNLPLAIAASIGVAYIPGISAAWAKKKTDEVNRLVNQTLAMSMLVTIPCAVGMGVLAAPIIRLLFPGADSMAARSMYLGFVSIIFFAQSTITNTVLQAMGKVMEPVKNALAALVLHLLLLAALLYFTRLGIYALVIGSISYSLLVCVFNMRSLRRYKVGGTDVWRTYRAPAISSIFMGAAAICVYEGVSALTGSLCLSVLAAVLTAMAFYAALVLRIGGYTKEELLGMPKGELIVKLAVRLHLM